MILPPSLQAPALSAADAAKEAGAAEPAFDALRPGNHALYVLTRRGAELVPRLAAPLRATVHANETAARHLNSLGHTGQYRLFSSLPDLLRQSFTRHSFHIFLCAAGIAVRCIAPLLQGKDRDPAVLVIDQAGRHVVSLLSGHLGQANACARHIAALLEAEAVITTATDCEELPAIDCLAQKAGLRIGNLGAAKTISAALLDGQSVLLRDPENRLGLRGSRWQDNFIFIDEPTGPAPGPGLQPGFGPGHDNGRSGSAPWPEAKAGPGSAAPAATPACVLVTPYRPPVYPPPAGRCLYLHPALLCAGIGCKRGASAAAILSGLEAALAAAGLSPLSLAFLSSLDAKTDEPGLVEAAAALSVPLLFFSRQELARYPVSAPSDKAREMFGIDGVCEPAALAAAAWRNGQGVLLRPKAAFGNVTVALALRRR